VEEGNPAVGQDLVRIETGDVVGVRRQCVLAGVSRATVYARRKPKVFAEDDHLLERLIDEEYTRHPFYGSRKMVVYLGRCGHPVNRKRAQRLMWVFRATVTSHSGGS